MTNQRRRAVLVGVSIAVVVLMALTLIRVGRRRHPSSAPEDAVAGAPASPRGGLLLRPSAGLAGVRVSAPPVPEPIGIYRLQGAVIDAAEAPVVGADVMLDSVPPRSAKSDENGLFAFADLRPRTYALEARAGDLYAGPVNVHLVANSDLVTIKLRAGATVVVAVKAAAGGTPVAGAHVELRSALVWQGETDARGEARLRGVGPGWRTLRVEAPGFAPAWEIVTTPPETRAQRVEIHLARGAPVAGRVVGPDGAPVARARVWARASAQPFAVVDPAVDSVATDAAGHWQMNAVAPGLYQFLASHPDFAEASTAPTAVKDGERRADVEIRMAKGPRIVGEVRTAAGAPVAGANVRASLTGALPWSEVREVWSDPAGRFTVDNLPQRPIQIVAVHADGSSPMEVVDLTHVAQAPVRLTISVQGVIEGLVVDRAGTPVPDAQLVARPAVLRGTADASLWTLRSLPVTISDAGGRFRLAGLESGSYRLRAGLPGAFPAITDLQRGVIAEVGAREVRVVVEGEGTLKGRVLFDDGSAPASFTIEVQAATSPTFSSSDGGFSFSVPAGHYDVLVTGSSFVSARVKDVAVNDAEITDLGVIRVRRGRSISGRVLTADGTPVARAEVAAARLLSGDGVRLSVPGESFGAQETVSGDDGRYTLAGFEDAPVSVVAQRAGMGRSGTIAVPRGPDSVEVDLVLRPTGGLSGTVARQGVPLAGAIVIARPRGTQNNLFVSTGPDGSYALETLTPGPYTLMVRDQAGARHIRHATVEAGTTTRADVELPAGSLIIKPMVTTDQGAPVAMAQVALVSAPVAGNSMEALLDRTFESDAAAVVYRRRGEPGSFVFDALVAGPYTACASEIPADATKVASAGAALLETIPIRCTSVTLTESRELTLLVPARDQLR